ncbi:hypothetical protein CPB85DRAFT_1438309 [Mucidula mucida]|nr:hypothetical protein CPB85DRAFT_1438309 [Mucidula mucida]
MAHHNGLLSSSSASRIPAEVWTEIFTFALPYSTVYKRGLYRASEAPWNVSYVCTFWRRTALCCSRLWVHDTIHIEYKTLEFKDPASLMKARLERARSRGCRVNFSLGLSAFRGKHASLAQKLFQVLIDYSTCWESVTLTVLAVCVDFINLLRGKLLIMRSLYFTYHPKSYFTGFEVCPLLERLILARPAVFETQSVFPWGHLREFINWRSQSSSDEDATATHYRNILTSSPNLQEFHVTKVMIPALQMPLAHQKLSYLHICNAEFLRVLSLPALQDLIISSTSYDSTSQLEDISAILLALFAASDSCLSLEYLLVADASPDVKVIHVFEVIPWLKQLRLQYQQWDETTVELMPHFLFALLTFNDTNPFLELNLDTLLSPNYNSVKFDLLPVLELFEMHFIWHPDVPDKIDTLVSGADLVQMLYVRYALPEHPSLKHTQFIFSGKVIEQPPEEVVDLYRELKKHGLHVDVAIHTRSLPTDEMEIQFLLGSEEDDEEEED